MVSRSNGHTTRTRPGSRWWAAALVLWVLFVWSRSLYGGDESSGQSLWVVERVRWLFESLGVTDADTMTFIVRKTAHFLEYLVLGVLASLAFGPWRAHGRERVRRAVAAAVVCACVPVADETIQLFVPGRAGMVADMLLDMSGCATGLLLAWLATALRRKHVQLGT